MINFKKVIVLPIITLVLLLGGVIWWNMPVSIISLSASEVDKIEIVDGGSGYKVILNSAEDTEHIEHIIGNLSQITMKKDSISLSLLRSGWTNNIKIYKSDGLYKEFEIQSSEMLKTNLLLYRDSSGSIDFDYIQFLIKHYNEGSN